MPSKTSPSEITWNPDTVHALGLCRMLTQILGIWPLDCQNLFSKARFCIVAFLQISMAISLVQELKADCVAAEDVVTSLSLVAGGTMAVMKITVLRLNQSRMELLIRSVVEDWSNVEDAKEKVIMRKHASTGRVIFIVQMSFVYAAIGSVIPATLSVNSEQIIDNGMINNDYNYSSLSASSLPPFLLVSAKTNAQRKLPLGTACSVAGLPTVLYALVYVVQVIQLSTTGAGDFGVDVYFFSIALHVCGQFELLKTRLERFGQDLCVHKCRMELKKLVRRHNQLITLSNNFEKSFNLLILVQLCKNAPHMGLAGLRAILSLQEGNTIAMAGSVIAIFVLSFQLFLYSYAGDYLTSQIEDLRNAVYCCRWYELPSTILRDLLFVMSRSNMNFRLTAGKVYYMNMNNFMNILKAMASYFSMLRIVFQT